MSKRIEVHTLKVETAGQQRMLLRGSGKVIGCMLVNGEVQLHVQLISDDEEPSAEYYIHLWLVWNKGGVPHLYSHACSCVISDDEMLHIYQL